MKLTLVYNQEDFKNQVESIAKQYNIEVDAFKDKSAKALKIKGYYGAKILPFCVIKDKDIEIPFYSDNNDCTIEHIDEVLNRYAERAI